MRRDERERRDEIKRSRSRSLSCDGSRVTQDKKSDTDGCRGSEEKSDVTFLCLSGLRGGITEAQIINSIAPFIRVYVSSICLTKL